MSKTLRKRIGYILIVVPIEIALLAIFYVFSYPMSMTFSVCTVILLNMVALGLYLLNFNPNKKG